MPKPEGVIRGSQYLVPVRKGGPWEFNGKGWELWAAGKIAYLLDVPGPLRQEGDRVRVAVPFKGVPMSDPYWWTVPRARAVEYCEWRPPRDWTGDLPEGTRLATDFVVGQRVAVAPAYPIVGTRTGGKVTRIVDMDDGQRVSVHWPSDGRTGSYGAGVSHGVRVEGY